MQHIDVVFKIFFLITKMESTKNNKNATEQKKLEIKTIIDDIRQLIGTYGSNHDEKTMNTVKKRLKKMKIYGVMKKMMILKT